jgi:RNA polymerase sporulation-specific sigma factor
MYCGNIFMTQFENCSDETLHQRAISGDSEAEDLLIRKYSALVRACARPYFLAGGDSEDLIQEGMLGLLSAVREYRPEGGASFRTFAELCIRRRLYSAIKKAAGRKHVALNDCLSLDPFFDENQTHAAFVLRDAFQRGPEEMVIDREMTDEFLSSFLRRLSKYEAEVLGLYLKGLSYQEIASEINRSIKSVDNAVQRIRQKLAQHINHGEISKS